VLSVLLAGCWDIRDIQDIDFLTAIGIDYKNGTFEAYVQMLDFSSVAKTETGKPSEPTPVWVGIGRADTLVGAFEDLYHTSQMRVFYGQIQTLVLGENALRHGPKEIKDLLIRYYEMRYTPWIYGTKEPIDQIFTVKPFFNYSPLISLLMQPQMAYQQQSFIPPMRLLRFVSEFREPGNSVLIPSLSISKGTWQSDLSPKPMIKIDGSFLFQDQKYRGWMSLEDIPGLRWMLEQTQRTPIMIRTGGKPAVGLDIDNPKIRIRPRVQGGKVAYSVEVKLKGSVSEVIEPIPEPLLKRKVEEYVENEIRQSFEKGLAIGVDLLHLEHTLYQKNNRLWKRIRVPGETNVTPDSLRDVRVRFNLEHSGKLKYGIRSDLT
jgi:Ger(x)C family germination protein